MSIWRQEVYGTGRCVNCGFLGKRSPKIDEVCFHASGKDRISGILNQHHTLKGSETSLSTIPWCFVGKADFLKELGDIKATVIQNDKVREVIERDRKCPSWYPWREFATPKEHFEDFKGELNRQERKRTNRRMLWLTIALIVFALLQLYAVLASINPERWLFKWLR